MADRCLRTSLSPPSSSVDKSSKLALPLPSEAPPTASLSSSSHGAPQVSRSRWSVAPTQARTVVCGLIGQFECTRSHSVDVKVTANSCRASDSVLIRNRDSPIARTPPLWKCEDPVPERFREIVTGNRNECSDKKRSMGIGGTGGRSGGQRTGEILNQEMDASVHRTRERQRKTVVYSRICLDDEMFIDTAMQDTDLHGIDGSTGNEPNNTFTGSSQRRVEVIRFPCVERLIEMYANIIRQKEAEVERFMSSIVRRGDKSRLDKVLSSTLSSTTGEDAWRGRTMLNRLHGSEIRQGDIRHESTLPASVSLESLPRTKTIPPTKAAATELTVDSKRSDQTQYINKEVSGNQTIENTSLSQSDEGWRSSTQHSSYGSSDEEEHSLLNKKERERQKMKNRDKVTRSSSSDSALGLDEDLSQQEQQQMIATVGKARRLTLGVSDIPLRSALLPVPEPSTLPSLTAPTSDHCPTVVRSKMILEAQLIELPIVSSVQDGPGGMTDPSGQQQQLGCPASTSASRRESAQSYVSDTGEGGVRYVRTPSVVVSDYSDDTMCGITLEEIEYFRRHRLRRGSADCESDISAASSCSNLNYCGSSISALEGCEYQCGLRTPERKVSDCSTCSTVSCDDDEGYSVVRSKLASLNLPSVSVTEAITPTQDIIPVDSIVPDPTSLEDGDVRICSKKKVSHTAGCSKGNRPDKAKKQC